MPELDTLGQDFTAELSKLVSHHQGNIPAYNNIIAQKGSTLTKLRVISITGAEGLFKADVLKEPLALADVTLPAGHSCGVRTSGPLKDPIDYYIPPVSTSNFFKFSPSIKFVVMHSFGRTYDFDRMRKTKMRSPSKDDSTFVPSNPATAYHAERFALGLQTYMSPEALAQSGMHHLVSLRGDLVNSASWDAGCTHVFNPASNPGRSVAGVNQRSIGINHEEWYYDVLGTGKIREVEDHGPYSEQQYVLDAFIIKKLEIHTGEKFTRYLGHGNDLRSNIASNTTGCFANASVSSNLDPGAEFFLPPDFQLGVTSVASVPLIKDLYGSDTKAWDRRLATWYKNASKGEFISAYARIFAKVERLRAFDPNLEVFDPTLTVLALDVKVPAITGQGPLAIAQQLTQNKLLAVNRAQQAQALPRNGINAAARGTSSASASAWAKNTAGLSHITQSTSSEPAVIVNALYLDSNTGEWKRANSGNVVQPVYSRPPLGGGTSVSSSPTGVYDYGRPDRKDSKGNVIVSRDPALLMPSFANRLQDLFNLLRAEGFKPLLQEGYRSPERAAGLAAEGLGIA
jgi:hypothetical protein